MQTNIVRIGNSKGIRIPQSVLDQCGIEEEVDLRVEKGRIILEPLKTRPRAGWTERFHEMHERGDERMLLPEGVDAEVKEWNW